MHSGRFYECISFDTSNLPSTANTSVQRKARLDETDNGTDMDAVLLVGMDRRNQRTTNGQTLAKWRLTLQPTTLRTEQKAGYTRLAKPQR